MEVTPYVASGKRVCMPPNHMLPIRYYVTFVQSWKSPRNKFTFIVKLLRCVSRHWTMCILSEEGNCCIESKQSKLLRPYYQIESNFSVLETVTTTMHDQECQHVTGGLYQSGCSWASRSDSMHFFQSHPSVKKALQKAVQNPRRVCGFIAVHMRPVRTFISSR